MATLDLSGTDHIVRMPTSFETRTHEGRFAARFDYRYQALSVIATNSGGTWTVSTYPGVQELDTDDINAATYVYSAPGTHTVTESALVTALTSAGYVI